MTIKLSSDLPDRVQQLSRPESLALLGHLVTCSSLALDQTKADLSVAIGGLVTTGGEGRAVWLPLAAKDGRFGYHWRRRTGGLVTTGGEGRAVWLPLAAKDGRFGYHWRRRTGGLVTTGGEGRAVWLPLAAKKGRKQRELVALLCGSKI
ncbi:hypothetical protein RRG08_024189 [Elysia crispata]|uniref:Uncharacterized protein n=1 Tax=Elysia crispata TaxID=231223 RepID=A0AAE1D387_9GAST|nr:hypothetical protein RRG08_024189 [Elysia crispata]